MAEYKAVRPLVQHGTLHRLRGPGDEGPTAVQYTSADLSEALVLTWHRTPRYGAPLTPVRLAGLDLSARHRDARTGAVHQATVLTEYGVLPDLPQGDWAGSAVHLIRIPRA